MLLCVDGQAAIAAKKNLGEEWLDEIRFGRACNPCRSIGEISFTDLQRRKRATVRVMVISTYKNYKKSGWHESIDRINVRIKNQTEGVVIDGSAYFPVLSYRKIEPPQGTMLWFPDQYRRRPRTKGQAAIEPGKSKEYVLTFDARDIEKHDETPSTVELWEKILKGEEFFDLIINPNRAGLADPHAKASEIPLKKISSR